MHAFGLARMIDTIFDDHPNVVQIIYFCRALEGKQSNRASVHEQWITGRVVVLGLSQRFVEFDNLCEKVEQQTGISTCWYHVNEKNGSFGTILRCADYLIFKRTKKGTISARIFVDGEAMKNTKYWYNQQLGGNNIGLGSDVR